MFPGGHVFLMDQICKIPLYVNFSFINNKSKFLEESKLKGG